MNALLVAMPDGRYAAVATKSLREHGWLARDDDFRAALPRADAPALSRPTAADVAAVRRRG